MKQCFTLPEYENCYVVYFIHLLKCENLLFRFFGGLRGTFLILESTEKETFFFLVGDV